MSSVNNHTFTGKITSVDFERTTNLQHSPPDARGFSFTPEIDLKKKLSPIVIKLDPTKLPR